MTELWWVVEAPDGRLEPQTFSREPDVARLKADADRPGSWPAMKADGYRVVKVEVRRVT